LAFGDWRLAIGDWRLAIGDWRLAIGIWHLAFGQLDYLPYHRQQPIAKRSTQSRVSRDWYGVTRIPVSVRAGAGDLDDFGSLWLYA
jgi:hypothetical protein